MSSHFTRRRMSSIIVRTYSPSRGGLLFRYPGPSHAPQQAILNRSRSLDATHCARWLPTPLRARARGRLEEIRVQRSRRGESDCKERESERERERERARKRRRGKREERSAYEVRVRERESSRGNYLPKHSDWVVCIAERRNV